MSSEQTDVVLSGAEIKQRLRARGITQRRLARETDLPETVLSGLLGGRVYCGPQRRARIEAGLARLGLDHDHATEPTPLPPGVFRIRTL